MYVNFYINNKKERNMYKEQMQEICKTLKQKQDVIILGIETSCDETSVAIVKNGREPTSLPLFVI